MRRCGNLEEDRYGSSTFGYEDLEVLDVLQDIYTHQYSYSSYNITRPSGPFEWLCALVSQLQSVPFRTTAVIDSVNIENDNVGVCG